jgi:hypothetical protein
VLKQWSGVHKNKAGRIIDVPNIRQDACSSELHKHLKLSGQGHPALLLLSTSGHNPHELIKVMGSRDIPPNWSGWPRCNARRRPFRGRCEGCVHIHPTMTVPSPLKFRTLSDALVNECELSGTGLLREFDSLRSPVFFASLRHAPAYFGPKFESA